jgi:hypothetical protein
VGSGEEEAEGKEEVNQPGFLLGDSLLYLFNRKKTWYRTLLIAGYALVLLRAYFTTFFFF